MKTPKFKSWFQQNSNSKMGLIPSTELLLLFFLIFHSLILTLFPILVSSTDYTKLVYKGCSSQKFQDPNGISSQNLETLFNSLVSQSNTAKFYKTSAGEGQSAINGLFQCRGDLSNGDCNNCVSEIPQISRKLCGKSIAGRIQLIGCHMRYEIVGFNPVSGTELLYKICGSIRASGDGFTEKLGVAIGEIEKGVVNGGSGFYTGSYESVYVLGQCEGELSGGDCGDCVKTASQRALTDCASSISAQIYLQQCYISYAYYPNGIPTKSQPGSADTGGEGTTRHNTQRTVAIVVGGVAGLGFAVACLLFLRSVLKKRDHSKHVKSGHY